VWQPEQRTWNAEHPASSFERIDLVALLKAAEGVSLAGVFVRDQTGLVSGHGNLQDHSQRRVARG
jgi:hypothetical protein